MILDKKGNTSIITQEKASIIELVKKIELQYTKLKNNNIIVNLTTINTLNEQDIAELLVLSNLHRVKKYSFVIVTNKIDLDLVPDDVIVAPTLQEAYDIIEMEEMERDLGF